MHTQSESNHTSNREDTNPLHTQSDSNHRRGRRHGTFDHFEHPGRHRGPERQRGGPHFEGRHGGGRRARRGDVRLAILALLAENPTNGYGLISQINDRTDGRWRPSPGSIYPVLRQLTDEGLVESDGEEHAGFSITEAGTAFVTDHQDDLDRVWDNGRAVSEAQERLHEGLRKLMGATRELSVSGTDEQRTRAIEILDETRRKLYGILAE